MRFHLKHIVYAVIIVTALFYIIAVTVQNVNILEINRGTSASDANLVVKHHKEPFFAADAIDLHPDFHPGIRHSLSDHDSESLKKILQHNPDDKYIEEQPFHPKRELPSDIIFPVKNQKWNDRIVNQMEYVPKSYKSDGNLMVIYMPSGLGDTPGQQKKFLQDECPVNRCWLTSESTYKYKADAVLFQNEYWAGAPPRGSKQIWILWLLESPFNSMPLGAFENHINWTATYRSDSTIVTPYEKFVHFDNFTQLPKQPLRNYAEGKTKLVAWFVSNCMSANKRMEYVHELQNHMNVDIYGACGPHKCNRLDKTKCNEMLSTDYKFYLAFENSNCLYYITEKFYWNALWNNVVPVVMGGRKEDYAAVSPPGSFIHIEDFANASALAGYLLKLDREPDLYNQYFLWKGTGHFINTKFWCRMCAMLHGAGETQTSRWYRNIDKWWRNDRTCTTDRWDVKEDLMSKDDWAQSGF